MVWRAQNLVQNITTCPLHTQGHFAPVNIIILTKQAVFIFCDEHGRIFVPNLSKKNYNFLKWLQRRGNVWCTQPISLLNHPHARILQYQITSAYLQSHMHKFV